MSAQTTRRQVLAFIALADAPMPQDVRFSEMGVDLSLATSSEIRTWLGVFGIEINRHSWRTQWYDRTSDITGVRTAGLLVNTTGSWRGWRVNMSALDEQAQLDEPVDEATREQLQQLVDQQLVDQQPDDDEPRCATCGEPASLLASGAVSHAGDGRGNPCGPAGSDRGVPDLRTDDDPYCCPTLPDDVVLEHRIDEEPAGFTPDEYEQIEVVTGSAAPAGSLAGDVPGEVYERDDVAGEAALPPGVAGFPVGEGPGRHGLPFADVDPSTVVIR